MKRRAPHAADGGELAPQASLLELEMDALVAELSPSARAYAGAAAALEALRSAFAALPVHVVDAAAHAAAFPALPLLRLNGDSAKLNFEPPARVTVVGSFASRTVAKVGPRLGSAASGGNDNLPLPARPLTHVFGTARPPARPPEP